jgi:hypothetical protein
MFVPFSLAGKDGSAMPVDIDNTYDDSYRKCTQLSYDNSYRGK